MVTQPRFVQGPPAKVGDTIDKIETPALVVEMEEFEYNLSQLPKLVKYHADKIGQPIRIRPHFKTHKTPAIASLQKSKGGAIGVCCAKLTEVESLVFGTCSNETWDILLTNELVSLAKTKRLIEVATKLAENSNNPHLAVCVDHLGQIDLLTQAFNPLGLKLNFYVEVNVGQNRGGVDTPQEVLQLVQRANESSKHLNFMGIHAYNGANQHVRGLIERKETVDGPLVKGKLSDCYQLLKENNIECPIITGGGTGTFPFEIGTGVYQEVQVGSYLFMDVDYRLNHGEIFGEECSDFKHSLFIYSRIQGQRAGSKVSPRLIIDCGLKGVSLDSGVPRVLLDDKLQPLKYISQGDEHGQLVPADDSLLFTNPEQFKLNDIIKLIPGHCDPTFNMHDYVVAVRDGKVEAVWPVEGRGPGY